MEIFRGEIKKNSLSSQAKIIINDNITILKLVLIDLYPLNILLKSVPSSIEIINNICKSGVTIQHNHANMGNYRLNNTIA